MSKRPTVLARLSWKFSHHPETVATEALSHILTGSAAAREALGGFLQSHGAEVGPIASVQTEVTGDEGDRPDLACFDQSGATRLLIESKFWAGLTIHQPVTYLKRLPEDEPSALMVVAPSLRIETLWPELKRRVRTEMKVDLGDTKDGSNVRRAAVGTRRLLILASWRALLEALASRVGASDAQAVDDIHQLLGLADLQDSREAFLPLRPEQLDPEIGRLISNLHRVVEDVCTRILRTDWADGSGFMFSRTGGYIRYMRLGGCAVWFGLKYDPWSRLERTPIWLGFQTSARHDGIPRKLIRHWGENPPESLATESLVPIRLLTGCEYQEVLDDVVRQLQDLASAFQEIYTADVGTRPDAGE
ncbi:MAG: hypothetical protein OXF41_11565 [bacterium]|nr:hypothetical protein [bacterium]